MTPTQRAFLPQPWCAAELGVGSTRRATRRRGMQKGTRFGFAAVLGGVLAITATFPLLCGAAAASTIAVPKGLVGCWHGRVPALPVGTPAGVWRMKIRSGGELLAFAPGAKSCRAEPDFTATISVSGSRLTIGPVPVCSKKGVYAW